MGENACEQTQPGHPVQERGSVRVVLLVLIFFLLGVGATVLWFHRSAVPGWSSGGKTLALTDATRTILANLPQPVEIRFYSVLDVTNLPPSVPALSAHVDKLLNAYEAAAHGNLKVTRFQSDSDATADAAAADGMKGFNREKGSVCYLGIAVAQDGRKEVLPHLSPEWQPALESDLTRAIARVAEPVRTATAPAAVEVDPAIKEQVRRTIPNIDSVSLEDGTRLLRENALKEFQTAAQDFQKQIEQAEQQLKQAQANGSAADQQAAMQHLQQIQAQQSEKLKEIAARSQAQIHALQQLKGSSQR